jgi:hypothetical protein
MASVVSIQPARGTMPVLQFCTPAQLQVDLSYQRATDAQASRTLINRITREWDWGLFQPLVVARRSDGNLYVVDGQHRLEAARQRGDIPQLPCVITAYDDAKGEAAAFVALNQQRRPLTQMNLHRAAVAAGEPDALLVDRLVEAAGLRLTNWADARAWKPGWVNMVGTFKSVLRVHGERNLRLTLETFSTAFAGQVLNSTQTIFLAIAQIVIDRGRAFDRDLLIAILARAPLPDWIARIRQASAERKISLQLAAKQLLAEHYAEAADRAEAA